MCNKAVVPPCAGRKRHARPKTAGAHLYKRSAVREIRPRGWRIEVRQLAALLGSICPSRARGDTSSGWTTPCNQPREAWAAKSIAKMPPKKALRRSARSITQCRSALFAADRRTASPVQRTASPGRWLSRSQRTGCRLMCPSARPLSNKQRTCNVLLRRGRSGQNDRIRAIGEKPSRTIKARSWTVRSWASGLRAGRHLATLLHLRVV